MPEDQKCFYFANAMTNKKSNICFIGFAPQCLEGDRQVGGYHNHPDSGGLSDEDQDWAKKHGPLSATWDDEDGNPYTRIADGPRPNLPPLPNPIMPSKP